MLWRDGCLLATYKDGRARFNAYLDDYAFAIDALLELAQADFTPGDLAFAQSLADALLERFEHRERGGFYFTSHDHEPLIHRPMTGHDGATPSGNGVAAYALQRLGHLVGEPRYLRAAERTLAVFHDSLQRSAAGHTTLATALEEALAPVRLVILRGEPGEARAWQARLGATYRPATMVVAVPPDATGLPAVLAKPLPQAPHAVSAWICEGVTCLPPVFGLAELERALPRVG
jgi:uncharacterized protein YyaL (SSP411 family)